MSGRHVQSALPVGMSGHHKMSSRANNLVLECSKVAAWWHTPPTETQRLRSIRFATRHVLNVRIEGKERKPIQKPDAHPSIAQVPYRLRGSIGTLMQKHRNTQIRGKGRSDRTLSA